jgi:hypothetical protein
VRRPGGGLDFLHFYGRCIEASRSPNATAAAQTQTMELLRQVRLLAKSKIKKQKIHEAATPVSYDTRSVRLYAKEATK